MLNNDGLPGGMQRWPLRATAILDHAANVHPRREVVSRTLEGPITRLGYASLRERARRCAHVLEQLGVKPGERVGTLAWNTHRHLEVWYACAGYGAVYHTINPRLFEEQIQWIVADAEDSVLFVDLTFVALAEREWGERPLLLAVRRAGASLEAAAVLEFLRDKVVRWAIPERVVFVESLPHTATGKLDKAALRARFANETERKQG